MWRRVVVYPQHCSLSGLLKEVEESGVGVQLSNGKSIAAMLFADDFVGVSYSQTLLKLTLLLLHK